MVDREVTLRIDQTLWSSPVAAVPQLPGELVMVTWGWTLSEGVKTPFAAMGGPRLEVGHQYLVAWIHGSDIGWEPQAVSTVLLVDGSGLAQRVEFQGDSPYAEAINAFVRRSAEEILRILESTDPDPVAKYFHLRPEQRYKAFVLEAEMPDRPGYLKAATIEGNIYEAVLGYVREEDWNRLGGAVEEIQLYDQDGDSLNATITIDDMIFGPDGLTIGGQTNQTRSGAGPGVVGPGDRGASVAARRSGHAAG
jgi:hypothetical protein